MQSMPQEWRPAGAVVDRAGARAIDHAAIHDYGIPGIVLMENAAHGLLEIVRIVEAGAYRGWGRYAVLIVCGPGNNGGDGYAVARLLHNLGEYVTIATFGEPSASSEAGINRAICNRMGIPICDWKEAKLDTSADSTVVDALFGTGLDRPVTGEAAEVIHWLNRLGDDSPNGQRSIVAADIPSGLDCDTGEPLGTCVRATHTVTFAAPKKGFLNPAAAGYLGRVFVADIGAPRELIRRFAIKNASSGTH